MSALQIKVKNIMCYGKINVNYLHGVGGISRELDSSL